MKKTKNLLIILSVILALILIAAITIGVIYINAAAVRFDHVDCDNIIGLELKDGSTVNYPFFGNSLMISEGGGSYGGVGLENIDVYGAVNMPVCAYVEYLARRVFIGGINLDYTVEQSGGILTVNLNAIGTDDSGKDISINKKLIFNIENASPENLPVWVNENDSDEEFKEYWNYLNNTSTTQMPDWYAESLGIKK